MMQPGLKAFLRELIDYAGIFPPASLQLPQALQNYRSYLVGSDNWVLGSFICPAGRLPEIEQLLGKTAHGPLIRVSMLATGGATSQLWSNSFKEDLKAAKRLFEQSDRHARVTAVEGRLPEELADAPIDRLTVWLAGQSDLAREHLKTSVPLFFELATSSDWQTRRSRLLDALAELRQSADRPVYFKVRCGGVTGDAFPAVRELAETIHACAERQVGFKATAGLHHPVRHYSPSVSTYMHGFLNLFGAGILATHHALDLRQIEEILAEEDGHTFAFDPDGFRWRQLTAPVAAIEKARRERVIAYGSCSFAEPIEDLTRLGLLHQQTF